MNRHIRRQIDEIIDTGEGEHRDVIVRMGRDRDGADPIVAVATEAIKRRSLTVSAREILPVEAKAFLTPPGEAIPRRERRILRAANASVAAQVTLAVAGAVRSASPLMALGLDALGPLLEAATVRTATESAARGSRSRSPGSAKPRAFWSSESAAMTVKKDDLASMIDSIDGPVRDVYPNRKLSPPIYVEARRASQAAEDNKTSAWGIESIGALSAWGAYDARGRGTRVAILDTGVDASHPDLEGKVTAWAEFDRDGNQVTGSQPHDTDRHGTHVAGTIAGGNASGQWIGVAPEAELAVAMVLDGRIGGTDAQVLAGIDWAIDQGVDVINMSLGGLTLGPDVPSTYTMAIVNALRSGIPVVAAIGNEGSQTTGSPGNDIFAFSVGAIDDRARAAGFSGGRTQIVRQSSFIAPDQLPLPYSKPDLTAPGVGVMSSVPDGKWAAFNGTSMATPHVAGAVSVLLSATTLGTVPPERRSFAIQDLLAGSVSELGESGQDHRYGFGSLNLLRAIGFAKERGF